MHCCWICVLNSKQRCLCCEIGRKWPSEFLSSLILWYTVCILVSSRTAWAVLCGALGEGLQWGGEPGVTLRVLFAAGALRSQDGLAVLLADDHMWVWAHGYECVLVYLSASQVPWVGCVPSLCQPNSWAGRWGPTYIQIAAGRSTVLSDGLCLLFAVPEMALEVKTQSTDRKNEEAWLFAALNACLIHLGCEYALGKKPIWKLHLISSVPGLWSGVEHVYRGGIFSLYVLTTWRIVWRLCALLAILSGHLLFSRSIVMRSENLKDNWGREVGRVRVEGKNGTALVYVIVWNHVNRCILGLGFVYIISSRPLFSCILSSTNKIPLTTPSALCCSTTAWVNVQRSSCCWLSNA